MAELSTGNTFQIKPGSTIGMNAAETDDEFLFSCFITTPAYTELINLNSTKMIAAGRTGTGKTAILRAIEENFGKTATVEPQQISMEYIANSDILNFLTAVGADLDLFFQVLWRHVLCVEYIRLRYDVRDKSKWEKCLDHLEETIGRNPQKKEALDYLRQYDGQFWITADQNLKQVVEKTTDKLLGEFATDFKPFKGRIEGIADLSVEKKEDIVARCKRIVTPEQVRILASLVNILAEDQAHGPKFFVLIDRLDDHWIDGQLRFRMIRALMESLPSFRRIRCLKIVVALRTDVLERVIQETRGLGIQREKQQDYIFDIRWTPVLLMQLVTERLQHLSAKLYGGRKLVWQDVFPIRKGHRNLASYIMDRTLHRPRDFLAYVNLCLEAAAGKNEVTYSIVREVERDYSKGRYDALVDEWQGTFPSIPFTLAYVASFGLPVRLREMLQSEDSLHDLVQRVLLNDANKKDPVYQQASDYLESMTEEDALLFLRAMVCLLYRIGAIGVRLSEEAKVLYSHVDLPSLSEAEVTADADIRIHPMYHTYLKGGTQPE